MKCLTNAGDATISLPLGFTSFNDAEYTAK